jgi:hypothetical protein
VGTAEELAGVLYAMSNYSAMAVFADGRYGLNGTLKAVEGVAGTCRDELKTLVVIVTTDFAFCHSTPP